MYEIDFSTTTTLDPSLWKQEAGFLRNRERQYYTPDNVTVRDGALVIEARREARINAGWLAGSHDWRTRSKTASYTSGSLVFHPPVHFGRVEVLARSPTGAGTWPAVWLLHEGPGEYGEIDIHEAVGKHPSTVFGAVHFGRKASMRRQRGGSLAMPGYENRWRLHVLEWTPERIEISVDGRHVFRFDPRAAIGEGIDPLRRPMRLHINLALGGTWGGKIDDTLLPARFEIRSLRVLRQQEQP